MITLLIYRPRSPLVSPRQPTSHRVPPRRIPPSPRPRSRRPHPQASVIVTFRPLSVTIVKQSPSPLMDVSISMYSLTTMLHLVVHWPSLRHVPSTSPTVEAVTNADPVAMAVAYGSASIRTLPERPYVNTLRATGVMIVARRISILPSKAMIPRPRLLV